MRVVSCAAICCAAFASSAQGAPPTTPGERLSRFEPPVLLERVEAQYPDEARKLGLRGAVLVQLVVGVDGRVSDARVVRPAGHGFDEAALAAARKLVFAPALQQGAPVAAKLDYEVRFEPEEKAAPPGVPYEATVEAERPFTAASARTVRDRDFLLRPRFTPEDILRVVPGLVLAQHQGGGKADQLFLRGFDADHGTDVSVNLDDIPVNLPSHAHGQGFADLHFLIPEAVERVEITKGPYFAELGDFDTAGAVNLVTRKSFEASQVSATGGVFPTLGGNRDDGTSRKFAGYRVLGIASTGADGPAWFAAEIYGTGGPFLNSERLQRYNLFAKATTQLSPQTTVSLLATVYGSGWTGSGQLPARLVDAGVIDRYGAVDPSEGGDTQRQQAILALVTHPDARSTVKLSVSALRYGLTLFNDFTFQARDPVHGDEIEQDDQRTTLFASARYERVTRLDGALAVTTLGAQARSDDVQTSLWKVQQRVRLARCLEVANPCIDAAVRQSDVAGFLQEDLRPARWLRLVLGLRSDLFVFDVHSLKSDNSLDPANPAPPGPAVQRSIVSPKASVVVTPVEELDLYLNFGTGFHSNDARSAVENGGAGALPRAVGVEAGARTRLLDGRLDLAAALWQLDLQSELTWNGDEGGTTASGATRRQGVDLEGRLRILPWLYADADLSLAKSRFKVDSGNGNAVALAPPRILTAGLTVQEERGVRASVRLRHIGARPGSQLTAADGVPPCTPALGPDAACYLVADGYTVLDATVSWVQPRWSVTLLFENLTNAVYREAQFGNVSQVIAPPPGSRGFVPELQAAQDIHFTPGNPLAVHLGAALYF